MDDASVIIRKFLGSATGAQLRVGLVSVVSFLGLINSSGLPALVSPYVIVFLAIIMAISLSLMLILALKPVLPDSEGRQHGGKSRRTDAIEFDEIEDQQVPSIEPKRREVQPENRSE